MPIIGQYYRFDYPKHFTTLPEYTKRIGQSVLVTKELDTTHRDLEIERMFIVLASDNYKLEAFESELVPFDWLLGGKA